MWKEERLQVIRSLLKTYGRVSVERVANDLNVSRETIRRDFLEMEQVGELKRIHGGAITLGLRHEPPLTLRKNEQIKEKKTIAKAVVTRIRSGQSIFIDAGSTTSIVAEELAKISGISVLTNSLSIAQRLSDKKCKHENSIVASLLGGVVHEMLPATFGEKAISEIYRHHADVAILSAVGIHAQHGATSFDPAEAEVARAMARNSEATYVLADSTKIGMTSRVIFCTPQEIDVFFTDKKALSTNDFLKIQDNVKEVVVG